MIIGYGCVTIIAVEFKQTAIMATKYNLASYTIAFAIISTYMTFTSITSRKVAPPIA